MRAKYKKVALIIMDGWGKEVDKERSAIYKANTPNVDSYYDRYPNSTLVTFGEKVGLPEGQMGNSEVGHMNLGAGRVVYQELARINRLIERQELQNNEVLRSCFEYALKNNKPVHLMGLVSDGGVHSHYKHAIALSNYAKEFGIKDIFIHAFTDGRDCAPDSGIDFIRELEKGVESSGAKVATVVGRYYAMDRDKRWERIKLAYDLLTKADGKQHRSAGVALADSYSEGVTDEFVKPRVIIDENGDPIARIQDGDVIICFNFRTDRCRQITTALTQTEFQEHGMQTLDLYYATMTRYDDSFTGVHVLLEKDNLTNTLGEVLSLNGRSQLRIAETEKYPHVTFFFSGGREDLFEGEVRIMEPSPKVATYDLQPEMSALQVTEKVLNYIDGNAPDFICLNFANTDMVGHTGIFEAAVKAAETVDSCVGKVVDRLLQDKYGILLTADHGNADIMVNEDGSPHTSHTKNLVPLFFISENSEGELKNGKLGDLAPTLLHLLGIDIPDEMTGDVLL